MSKSLFYTFSAGRFLCESYHILTAYLSNPFNIDFRKYTATSKVPDTRGCIRCCVGRNPYNGYKYLCGALPTGVILMQWYEPLNKFMQLKVYNFLYC